MGEFEEGLRTGVQLEVRIDPYSNPTKLLVTAYREARPWGSVFLRGLIAGLYACVQQQTLLSKADQIPMPGLSLRSQTLTC